MTDIPIRTAFPRQVREIENTWIPMPDGTQLAARIWLPEDAEADPVPAILEYLPYRKRDGTVARDHMTHPYFAGHGYAGVRVDMRGTGDSEGVCFGEYLLQEQDDALAVIDWIAKQPWCSGKVGMMGISWGGFNGLQIAARQPEALGAVITLCSTDDRYADDIHFLGGAILTDKLDWGATAFAIANMPPDPAIVGADRWRDMWLERLDNNGLWLLDWFRHQRRDDFYRHGSICEDYSAVQVPVFAIGGYADGYTNTPFRMMQNLPGPRKALLGPWGHKYPHFAVPGPQVGFLQEALRWWDQHLKGIDTGIMEEPMIRGWMQHAAPPNANPVDRPGHWVAEPGWPSPGVETHAFYPTAAGLMEEAPKSPSPLVIDAAETAGYTAPAWFMSGVDADGPLDQNGELGLMPAFETSPLAEDLQILGLPLLHVRLTSNTPQANLAAVLSMVAPDGQASFVTYGALNLTHRDSHAAPEPIPADREVEAVVQLKGVGQTVPAGYRLRLAITQAYWPIIWPSQEKAVLTLSAARLDLPIRDASANQVPLDDLPPAETATPLQSEVLEHGSFDRSRSIDYPSRMETYRLFRDTGLETHLHSGLTVRSISDSTFRIHPDDPNSATGTCTWHKSYARGDWRAEVDVAVSVAALRDVWRITASLMAKDADGIVRERTWAEDIPRDLV